MHVEKQLRSKNSSTALEDQLSSLTGQLDQLNQQLQAFEKIQGERRKVAEQRSAVKKETEQVLKSKKDFQAKLDDARSKYASSVVRLEEAKARQAAVEAERIANDKVHAEQIIPGTFDDDSVHTLDGFVF